MPGLSPIVNTFLSEQKNKQKTSLDELNVCVSTTKLAEHCNSCVCYKLATMTTQTLPQILDKMWSHIVWSVCNDPDHGHLVQGERHRHASHFESAQCIVLDIDNKDEAVYLPMVDAQTMLSELELLHVIAPTSSHQCEIDKSGNKCEKVDKYRILLFLDKPITDIDTYTTVYKKLLELFPASDASAKDAARQWYPRINQYDKTILRQNDKIYCTLLKDGYTLCIDGLCKECHGSSQKPADKKVKNGKEAKSKKTTKVHDKEEGHDSSEEYQLLTASYLPGTGRNNAICRDVVRLRVRGCSMVEARQFFKSRAVFDANFPEEKCESIVDWGYNKAQLKTKYDYKVSDATLEDCENLKLELAKKMLIIREDSPNFDAEDLKKAKIVIFENKIWIKTPKQPAFGFSASSSESCLQFIDAPAIRTKTVKAITDDMEEINTTSTNIVEDRKIQIRELFNSANFLKTQINNVLGFVYYPNGEPIIDDCLNLYVKPHYIAKDSNYAADVDLFLRIVNTVVNRNEHYVKWLLNWIRHLVEHPNQPLTRHPVILAPQGCCKGTLYTILEGLLGGNCLSIKGEDVFGKDAKFNSVVCTENVLICLDELKMTSAMVPEFKRLFKNTHQSKFEKKCVQGFKTRRIANFLILGNVEENVLQGLKSDERSIYPIKWEDHEFVKGSQKFNAAYGLFKELEKRMINKQTLKDMLSRQFISNIYHYVMSLEYSRDLLDEALTERQKLEAFEDNLTLIELDFIERVCNSRYVVFKPSIFVKRPINFEQLSISQQIAFNKDADTYNKLSRRGRLKDLIQRAGYIYGERTDDDTRVYVHKAFLDIAKDKNLLSVMCEKRTKFEMVKCDTYTSYRIPSYQIDRFINH